jgi:hypothetical protein
VVEIDQEVWCYDVLGVVVEVHTEVAATAPIAAALSP